MFDAALDVCLAGFLASRGIDGREGERADGAVVCFFETRGVAGDGVVAAGGEGGGGVLGWGGAEVRGGVSGGAGGGEGAYAVGSTPETVVAYADGEAVVFVGGVAEGGVVGAPGGAVGSDWWCGGVAGWWGVDDEGFGDCDPVGGTGVADDTAAFPVWLVWEERRDRRDEPAVVTAVPEGEAGVADWTIADAGVWLPGREDDITGLADGSCGW